jgi:hypothetical protein
MDASSVPTAVKDAIELVLAHFCMQAPQTAQAELSNVQPLSQSLYPLASMHQIPQLPSVLSWTSSLTVKHNITINRETTLQALYTYDRDALVEYPETSPSGDASIGHLFIVDPENWVPPTLNFAYSQGHPRGSSKPGQIVRCDVLMDDSSLLPSHCYEVEDQSFVIGWGHNIATQASHVNI